MTFPVTPDMVKSFDSGDFCQKTSPCGHRCEIVLFDGRAVYKHMSGDDIYTVINAIGTSKLFDNGYDYSHFEHYENNHGYKNSCFCISNRPTAEEILARICQKDIL
jgi:hypothetical protein